MYLLTFCLWTKICRFFTHMLLNFLFASCLKENRSDKITPVENKIPDIKSTIPYDKLVTDFRPREDFFIDVPDRLKRHVLTANLQSYYMSLYSLEQRLSCMIRDFRKFDTPEYDAWKRTEMVVFRGLVNEVLTKASKWHDVSSRDTRFRDEESRWLFGKFEGVLGIARSLHRSAREFFNSRENMRMFEGAPGKLI